MSRFEALKKLLKDNPGLTAGLGLSVAGSGYALSNMNDANSLDRDDSAIANALSGAGLGAIIGSGRTHKKIYDEQGNLNRLVNKAHNAFKGMDYEPVTPMIVTGKQ